MNFCSTLNLTLAYTGNLKTQSPVLILSKQPSTLPSFIGLREIKPHFVKEQTDFHGSILEEPFNIPLDSEMSAMVIKDLTKKKKQSLDFLSKIQEKIHKDNNNVNFTEREEKYLQDLLSVNHEIKSGLNLTKVGIENISETIKLLEKSVNNAQNDLSILTPHKELAKCEPIEIEVLKELRKLIQKMHSAEELDCKEMHNLKCFLNKDNLIKNTPLTNEEWDLLREKEQKLEKQILYFNSLKNAVQKTDNAVEIIKQIQTIKQKWFAKTRLEKTEINLINSLLLKNNNDVIHRIKDITRSSITSLEYIENILLSSLDTFSEYKELTGFQPNKFITLENFYILKRRLLNRSPLNRNDRALLTKILEKSTLNNNDLKDSDIEKLRNTERNLLKKEKETLNNLRTRLKIGARLIGFEIEQLQGFLGVDREITSYKMLTEQEKAKLRNLEQSLVMLLASLDAYQLGYEYLGLFEDKNKLLNVLNNTTQQVIEYVDLSKSPTSLSIPLEALLSYVRTPERINNLLMSYSKSLRELSNFFIQGPPSNILVDRRSLAWSTLMSATKGGYEPNVSSINNSISEIVKHSLPLITGTFAPKFYTIDTRTDKKKGSRRRVVYHIPGILSSSKFKKAKAGLLCYARDAEEIGFFHSHFSELLPNNQAREKDTIPPTGEDLELITYYRDHPTQLKTLLKTKKIATEVRSFDGTSKVIAFGKERLKGRSYVVIESNVGLPQLQNHRKSVIDFCKDKIKEHEAYLRLYPKNIVDVSKLASERIIKIKDNIKKAEKKLQGCRTNKDEIAKILSEIDHNETIKKLYQNLLNYVDSCLKQQKTVLKKGGKCKALETFEQHQTVDPIESPDRAFNYFTQALLTGIGDKYNSSQNTKAVLQNIIKKEVIARKKKARENQRWRGLDREQKQTVIANIDNKVKAKYKDELKEQEDIIKTYKKEYEFIKDVKATLDTYVPTIAKLRRFKSYKELPTTAKTYWCVFPKRQFASPKEFMPWLQEA